MLYELLSGEPPWSGALESIIYKICREAPPVPSQTSKIPLSPAVDALIARALAKVPEQRFTSGRQFQTALRAAFESVATDDDRTRIDMPALPLQPALVPAWDDTILSTVERQFAGFVGPMARVMVRKAASQARDLAGLYSLLSENIGAPAERRRFVDGLKDSGTAVTTQSLRTVTAHSGTRSAQQSTAHSPAAPATDALPPLNQAFVDQIAGRLAVHIGPIAKVVAKKAAQKATTRSEFVRLVAAHLGAQERGAFLHDVGFPAG